MRIVFMGASELGWECCQKLLEIGQDVVGIFSIPAEFRISWSATPVKNVRYRSFEDLATRYDLPIIFVTGKMSAPEYREALQQLRPDILVVIGWYYLLPRSLRELAPKGAVGIHASLLPKYRGGAPLVWAIINGETEAGVSLFYLNDGVDDGDLISQSRFHIGIEDDIAAVVKKSIDASISMVAEFIPQLALGTAPRTPQDSSLATVVPQRQPEDGLIEWNQKSAVAAYNWIRAQTKPYPGAFTSLDGEKFTIWKASVAETANGNLLPGQVMPQVSPGSDSFGVGCADQRVLMVHEVGMPAGETISGAEFARIRGLHAGQVLGS